MISRSAVLDLGLRPRSNTANLGPVTGPVRNNLINNIIVYISHDPVVTLTYFTTRST